MVLVTEKERAKEKRKDNDLKVPDPLEGPLGSLLAKYTRYKMINPYTESKN